jgi:RNA polymerase sigma factor (sigma-70 family)
MNPRRKAARKELNEATQSDFESLIAEARLYPRQKEIVVMRYLEGKTNYQIAMDLNIAVDTVNGDLQKAYDKIARVISKLKS